MSWLEVLSGQRRDPLARLFRIGLSGLTPLYRLVVAIRNARFDRARPGAAGSPVQRAPLPVISVGNLTTGGTGKTPHVIAIASRLRHLGCRVVILSRGYGADPGESRGNDEALELEHRLPDVPQLQDRDRVALARLAFEEFASQVAVLDDGFQHRQLARDLDIVLVDATLPWGYGRLLPRGLLREPPANLRRADLVVLTRVDQVAPETCRQIRQQIASRTPAPIIESRMRATGAMPYQGPMRPLESISAEPTLALCAIGNPDNFFASLEKLGFPVVGRLSFPDHHNFDRADLQRIEAEARRTGAQQILCTHKDLVKLAVNRLQGLPIWAVRIEVDWVSGWQQLDQRLTAVVEALPPDPLGDPPADA